MWLSHPINPSKYKIVRRFDLIVAIAKVMRGCHFYYVNAQDHTIYGVPEEAYSLRSVPLPPNLEITDSFLFRIDTMESDVLNTYIDFIILDDIPWAAIPLMNAGDLHGYRPTWNPVSPSKLWTVKKGRSEVPYLDLLAPDTDKSANMTRIRDYIASFLNARQFAVNPVTFPHMERHPVIRKIFQSKISIGDQYVSLKYDGKSYGMFMFRSMFTLNKNDELYITVNDRGDNPNIFEAHFGVVHDKNPIKYIIEGSFIEFTHAAFVRLN